MINEPLGLPKGSVRAIIALLIAITFCIGSSMSIAMPDLKIFLATIVGFYFGARTVENNTR